MSQAVLKCSECVKKGDPTGYSSLNALEIHLVKEHFNNCFIHECPLCENAYFPTEQTLLHHCNQLHQAISKIELKQSMNESKLKARYSINECLNKCVFDLVQGADRQEEEPVVVATASPATDLHPLKAEPITICDEMSE